MNLIDLLRMSSGNLRRRKLRTLLTVLGVVIGTASIVVMISLGLGLQQSLYAEVEQMGGISNLKIYGKNEMYSSAPISGSAGSGTTGEEGHITSKTLKEFAQMEHVVEVSPALTIPAIFFKGKYMSYMELRGMPKSKFSEEFITLEEGSRFPEEKTPTIELLFGNWAPEFFHDARTGVGYWETGEFPDITYDSDQFQVIFDEENYMATQSGANFGTQEEGASSSNNKPAKKHIAQGVGIIGGGVEGYNQYSWGVYCDIDTLVEVLKKEFAGRAIPGQPLRENGKPYREIMYTYADVKVDHIDNLERVSQQFRDMGYDVESNMEYVESIQSQFAVIQMVLGGIGAISLLVAAIGITNTMMMSIYERTKEIGVLKVLGCDMKNIKQLFLMEAAGIGLLGGLAGNVLSFILSKVMNVIAVNVGSEMGISQNISYIPYWLALGAMGIAISVGMIAGYFPARRAMKLSALEAIRTN